LIFPIIIAAALLTGNEFSIQRLPIIYPPNFTIQSTDGSKGSVSRRLLSLSSAFDLYDEEGNGLAYSSADLFSWSLLVDIKDQNGNYVGKIEEDFWRVHNWPKYNLYNCDGEQIAIAVMDPLEIGFSITDPNDPDRILASLIRPPFSFVGDRWELQLFDPAIDRRILMLLAAYQSNRDLKIR